ncbi:cation-independent mannose-6-phosphate receptor-like [Lineus longissimus]|uniref:cation-independent mannose-6-phosphate receptor-like n=1 Tax=Lineus longissimus TaxID=88925 RepID=UPI00315D08D7
MMLKISLFSYLPLFMLVVSSDLIDCDSCTSTLGDKYDFSPLARWPWEVKVKINNTLTAYKINICKNASSIDKSCPGNSSICCQDSQGARSIGNYSQTLNVTEDTSKKELWLYFHGGPCSVNKGQSYMTAINIKCGNTLGSPKFLESYACDTYFEWHSTVACKKKTTASEVPCSIYNKDGKKVDLTPLIMTEGAYKTDTATYSDFYINVCRAITPGTNTSLKGCSPSTAACQTHMMGVANMGSPADRLQYDAQGNLILHYNTSVADKPSGCVDTPSTTVTFLCPKRGGGQNPKLTSFFNCQYQVLWETEYACPEETLTSNTCKLTQEQHGVDIDLSPLTKGVGSAHPYRTNFTTGGKTYVYFINVCGELGIDCPTSDNRDGISVCQKSFSDPSFGEALGRLHHQTLRYSDGELTMTYQAGDACSSHFSRTTVITFHCNQSAEDDGRGKPVFNSETNCTYLFDWSTKYACVSHPKMCRVNVDKKQFDLSTLIRTKENNWEALTSHLLASDESKSRYFINICGDILKSNLTNKCPDGAAACSIDQAGKAKSLGQYVQGPVYLTSGDIQLVYKNGSPCTDKSKNSAMTTITLTCKPGDLESGPVLVHRSDDKCFYDFRWQTAAACVLGRKIGTNCRVSDNDAGFNFDLSRLTKTGDASFYKTNDTSYDYLINVCAPIGNGKCKDAQSGVCQVNKKNVLQNFNLGKASDTLYYFDGMINLTYSDGDNYHTTPPIARKTEIVFLCDPNAGIGHPEFHHEGNHSYTFRWFTKYACAEAPLECIVTDPKTNEQYDLSGLSKSENQQNWERVDDSDSKLKRKFYLNVCRPLNPVHVRNSMCDTFAAACMSEFHNFAEEIKVKNLGHALTPPTLESQGKILLKYTNGSECVDDNGKHTNYTTNIHLQCTKGQLSTSPSFLRADGKCEYSFLWETAAACPIVDTEVKTEEKCTLKDAKTGYVYNLQPLMKRGTDVYSADGGTGTTYKLNICGAVSTCGVIVGKDAAACQVKDEKVTLNLATESSQKLQFSDDGTLTLTYEGGLLENGDRTKVVISFNCHRDKPLGDVKFLKKEGTTYLFQFDTSLACAPQAVDCIVSDQYGYQYDLSTLSKVDSSWMVPDSRSGHSDLQYYINVCRPINSIPGTNCPGGPVGGCQVSITNKQSHGMGYIQSNPSAENGTVSIRYLGGEICHAGTLRQNHRSTRIIFYCSPTEHSPTFLKETPECEYVFEWRTPAACAVQQIIGHGCKVTDPLYHIEFDLNPLHLSDKDYHVPGGGYEYLINVCGHLNEGKGDCDGSKGIGSCQTKAGSATIFSGGLISSDIKYEDGEITVEYNGGTGNCHSKYPRSTIIKFLCDHNKIGSDGPKYVVEKDDCTYVFTWQTSRACPPFKKALACDVRDSERNYFDFSDMTQSSQNYEYTPQPSTMGIKFFINVCASVVHGKGSTCPFNSAACLVNITEKDAKKKYRNIGEVNDHMLTSDDKGNLMLKYINGDQCKNGKNATTTILLICEKTAYGTKPEYAFVENDCDYHFTWMTRKACVESTSAVTGGNCTTTNPDTGYKFDLSSLKSPKGYEEHDKDGHTYLFNICDKIATSNCKGNSGVCQSEDNGEHRSFNLGDYSDKPIYDRGIISLNYTNGDKCHRNNYTRNTVITFVCGPGDGSPVFIQETSEDCTYYISWPTKLACEKQVQCLVDNGTSVIDLSPLIKNNEYYLAIKSTAGDKDPKGTFYINVCRPLNPIRGVLCPPGSAACRVEAGKKPVSLGLVETAPFIDKDTNKVTIMYDHGVQCATNPKKNTTSKIVFSCVTGTPQGHPQLEDITNDCVYVFSWGTSVVCPYQVPKTVGECKFKDSVTDVVFDLSTLKIPLGSYEVPYGGKKYYVNLCGGVADKGSICKRSGVCTTGDKEKSYGLVSTQKTNIEFEKVTISYSGGDTCMNADTGQGASHILLECDPHAGHGKPVVLGMSACSISFLWQTSLVCPTVAEKCSITDNGNTYDLSILSRDQGSWNITDEAGNMYWINICQGLHLQGTQSKECPPGAAVCRKTTDGTLDILGMVTSQQLMIETGEKLVLKYAGGTDACSHATRRSDKPPASVVIEFECAATVGGPVLLPSQSDDSSCVFRFQWKTRMACKVERQLVKEVNGEVMDPRSGGSILLKELYSKGHNYEHTEHRGSQVFDYMFSLEGKLHLDASEAESSKCKDAVVCKTDRNNVHSFTNLGSYSTRKYYMEDDVLEGVYTSDQKCDADKSQYFQSIIVFHCDDSLEDRFKRMSPMFTYQAKCTYLFDWYTYDACIVPKIEIPKPVTAKTAHSGVTYGKTNASTVGAIVGVFSGIIIICILVIVFHKKERRVRFTARVRRIFKRTTPKTYQYSVLAQGEDDDFLLSGPTVEDEEITNGDTPVASYHDESDDDLIL